MASWVYITVSFPWCLSVEKHGKNGGNRGTQQDKKVWDNNNSMRIKEETIPQRASHLILPP
jgi:hypothetical protein